MTSERRYGNISGRIFKTKIPMERYFPSLNVDSLILKIRFETEAVVVLLFEVEQLTYFAMDSRRWQDAVRRSILFCLYGNSDRKGVYE